MSATDLNPQVSKDATTCERPDNRQVSGSDGVQQDVNVLRAVILTERLQNVGRRWEKIGPELWAMLSYGGRFVDTTLIPADQLMWRRTTLLKVNGSWELVELSEQISTMEDRCKWFDTDVQAEAILTLGHTNVMSPEALGFRLEAPHAIQSEPARGSGDFGIADAAEAAAPADARAELPPEERVVPLETNEVFVDGVLLNETSSLRALRAACSFLGLSQTGNRAQCLKRILRHVRERELIDAEAVGQRLQVDAERTPEQQRVPPEPSQAEKDIHDLVHIPYKDWCPLCVSFKARQDRHPPRDHATSSNSVVSFDFGYASRKGDEDKLTVLFAHDRFTGAMIGIPTPAKGGKYMPYLGTELARFVVSTGHNPVTLRCDNEPSTLALLDTVRKALRAVNVHTNVETSAPHDHQANGAAEVTVQVIRQQAALLLRQLEIGGGSEEFLFGSHHPMFAWSMLHASWLHNRFMISNGFTAFEKTFDRQYTGKLAKFGECVMGYLKSEAKSNPKWIKGIWLGKSPTNDTHMIGTAQGVFVTRSIRRFSNCWNLKLAGDVENCPWDYGYAALGSKLVLAKRLMPPRVEPISFPEGALMYEPPESTFEPETVFGPRTKDLLTPDEAAADPVTPFLATAPGTPFNPIGGASSSTAGDMPMMPAPMSIPDDTALADLAQAGQARAPRRAEGELSERPTKTAKLTQVSHVRCVIDGTEYTHEDEHNPTYFQDAELDGLEDYDETLQSLDVDEPGDQNHSMNLDTSAAIEQLKYPHTEEEPDLSPEELGRLDQIADKVELSRLAAMGVLLDSSNVDCSDHVELSTRFVRTWRSKRDETTGVQYYLRRSRVVAREFSWLSPDRADLYSPASSNVTTRLVPLMFLANADKDWAMMSLDVSDAFLTVNQERPTVVTAVDAAGVQHRFILGKVLPGQRDGSLLWHRDLAGFLKTEFGITPFGPYPSLLRNDKCLVIIHVDDMLFTGDRSYLLDVVLPAFKSRYQVSHEMVDKVGTELSFLKRRHVLLSKDELFIQPHVKHASKLFEMLKIKPNMHPKKTPAHPEINEPDETSALNAEFSSVFRTCVGVLLYLSADLVECQFVIRYLAQCMQSPTERSYAVLRHLCLYMLGCVEHGISLKMKARGSGLYHDHDGNVLEVYSGSDWAAHKGNRKSVSSVAIFHRGCLIYSASRTQKVISLSSAEAELHAAVSSTCDSILISMCLEFLSGEPMRTVLYIDNSAARQILQRQGVGRIRHLSVKLLWLQTRVRDGLVSVKGIESAKNVADVGTKRLGLKVLKPLLFHLGVYNPTTGKRVGEETIERIFQVKQLKKSHLFAVLCNLLVSGGNTLSPLVMAADDECETAGISLRDEGSEGTTWKVLLVIILFFTTLAVIRWIYVCYHNRRIRQMRDEYGDLDISEAHDPDEWMAFHHNVQFPDRADPILTEDDPMEEDEEEVEENRKLKVRYPIENSRIPHSPAAVLVWFTERIERRVARGFYAPSYVAGRLQALSDFIQDCLTATTMEQHQVYMEVIGNLGDLSSDEDSPIHQLGAYGIETELRQAHQAIQIGTSLVATVAAAATGSMPSTGGSSAGSVVTDAIADSMISGTYNPVSRYMRGLNDPGRMDGEN